MTEKIRNQMLLLLKNSQKGNTRQGVQKVFDFFKKSVDIWIFIWYYYKAVAKKSAVNCVIMRFSRVLTARTLKKRITKKRNPRF